MDLRPFKREFQGFIMGTDIMAFVRHDEVPLGTPLGEAMRHIARDAVKHGATQSMLNINLMWFERAYRLFGIRITPWRLVYDFDTEDEETNDLHPMLLVDA